MSIRFKTIQRINPKDLAAPRKYYATVEQKEKIGIDRLSEKLAAESIVSRADASAVFTAVLDTMLRELKEGSPVEMGKLGTISISFSSRGMASEDEVTAASISKARIIFRPGKELKDMLKTLKFEKNGK
ncbi:MAG: HU family DNA-binding protein [Bacteroidota bacterium]